MTDKRNKYVEVNKASGLPGPSTRDQNEVVRLVQKAIGGDSEAFGELYMTYVEPIYRYIFYQVRDKMTAEDITEDAFFKAWNSIHSCKGKEQTFSSWLYRIAHNSMIDVFRSRKKELFLDTETAAGIIDDKQELETEGRTVRQNQTKSVEGENRWREKTKLTWHIKRSLKNHSAVSIRKGKVPIVTT